MKRKTKDVTGKKKASPVRVAKKPADLLPKILEMAATTGSLQIQRVRCGKANCKCARGHLHEGYYFFWSTPGGVRKRYVRRADVPLVRAVVERRKRRSTLFRTELRQARSLLQQMLASVKVKL
jgi:Family of unknown function (DUF6788)